MVLRDDGAAALARAEALERELADREADVGQRDQEIERLRAELQEARAAAAGPAVAKKPREKKAKTRRERARPATPEATAPRQRKRRLPAWVVHLGGTAVATVGIFGLILGFDTCSIRYFDGAQIERTLLLVPSPGAPRLLLLDSKSRSRGRRRIDVLDPRSGDRLARVVVSARKDGLWPAGPKRVWLVQPRRKGVDLLELPSLRPVRSWSEIVARTPALHDGIHGSVVAAADGAAHVTTNGGVQLRIDPQSGEARPSLGGGVRPYQFAGSTSYQAREADVTYSFAKLPGSQRKVLRRRGREAPPASALGLDSFLRPVFLRDRVTGQAVRLPQGGFVIDHRRTLRRSNELWISGVTREGKRLWTSSSERGTLRGVYVIGGLLVAVDKYRDKAYVLALELATGKLRWRYRA